MLAAREAELLSLWEIGQSRHPIDRALLLCAWARPEVAHECLAQWPLGAITTSLLQMRRELFGPHLEVQFDCEHCGQVLEAPLTLDQLLADAPSHDELGTIELHGFVFRVPQSDDLAAIVGVRDSQVAAMRLLERCCVRQPGDGPRLAEVLDEAQTRMEAADPMADLWLEVTCVHCGAQTGAALDAAALLWTEIQAHARALLTQVHLLARAYGWTEAEVLSLSPARRSAYLDLVAD